jgi:hypothetical protein
MFAIIIIILLEYYTFVSSMFVIHDIKLFDSMIYNFISLSAHINFSLFFSNRDHQINFTVVRTIIEPTQFLNGTKHMSQL